MATLDELKARLSKPLEAELAAGCPDTLVAGGLEALMQGPAASPFPKVREVLAGYAQMSAIARAKALKQALAQLAPTAKQTKASTTLRSPQTLRPTSKTRPTNQQQITRLSLDASVEQLAVGRDGPRKLHSLGLYSLRDVLHAYPHRHEDRRTVNSISQLQEGEKVTVQGRIISKFRRAPKPKMLILEVVLLTASGQRVKATWFNQPWLEKQLKEGKQVVLTGRVKRFGKTSQLSVEHMETLENAAKSLSTGRIVGVYEAKEGISQEFLRKAAYMALKVAPFTATKISAAKADYLPQHWRKKYDITHLPDALIGIHFPKDEQHLARATRRLRFDEYLFLQLRMLLQGEDAITEGKRFVASQEAAQQFEEILPFSFTNAQRRVLTEIMQDMRSDRQMARLVQGDVGSGKTAVAACALYLASQDGYQGALMAPTEILARQHYHNLVRYMQPLNVRVDLLIGAMTPKQKEAMQIRIATGEVDIVIGTQALIQDNVTFHNLGLAVIDEEHRFGVRQRRQLLKDRPDVLVMSATPIPRSLALTAYGDLELSIIDQLPAGRLPIITQLLQDNFRNQAYRLAMTHIRQGRQAYAVTALIDENEEMELLSAIQLADDLKARLPEARIDLLHGKMNATEKEEIMQRFRRHEFDLLVSTTVIEVGVDVPNANVMVIENAERFGLAQLHQLRGRVGRGQHQSYCLLVAGEHSQKTEKRLKVIEDSNDGFVIAEADLKMRGPGEIRGTRQAGIPDLRLADMANDTETIEQARELAKHILAHDPKLEHKLLGYLRSELQNRSQSVAYREII